jgi:hypothetical protein
MALYVPLVRNRGIMAEAIAKAIDDDRRKAPLMVKLARAVKAGDITREEIDQLLDSLPGLVVKSGLPQLLATETLLIAPGWKLIQTIGGGYLRIEEG